MDELSARLACHQLCLPNSRLVKALKHFGSTMALFEAERVALGRFFRQKDLAQIDRWNKSADSQSLAIDQNCLTSGDIELLAVTDEIYPTLLKEIPDPPAFLYVHGEVAILKRPQIAIVGSRKMTPLGANTARQFASALGNAGLAITSGLALGIDSCAHMGALDAGAPTIAVLGTGIDGRYPRSNAGLYDQIRASGGVLVSEYPLGTPPRGANFPKRNRIITGLSMATLVVEASEKSGSLVSARLAAEQGRDVFAIPGNLSSPASIGCHNLIREGATLVTTPAQILEDLGAMLGLVVESDNDDHLPDQGSGTPDDHWLLIALGQECLSVDQLCDRSGKPPQEVATAITSLELTGVISASAYGYQRVV